MAAACYTVLDGKRKSREEMQSTATFRTLKAFFTARPVWTACPNCSISNLALVSCSCPPHLEAGMPAAVQLRQTCQHNRSCLVCLAHPEPLCTNVAYGYPIGTAPMSIGLECVPTVLAWPAGVGTCYQSG